LKKKKKRKGKVMNIRMPLLEGSHQQPIQ